ncbi:MAG: filamentous hemagglutinin N-terminal domain-containing protein [Sterolibacteriaceae bacterium MAG5]|nr:filamentous hemagglutinin N-terminal domain-containing protein [Candidatus Nitricoxidireducens bremensis]
MSRSKSLNHVFRIVWNTSKSVWQAVCETGKARGRDKSSRRLRRAAALAGLAAAGSAYASPAANELPTGGTVVAGGATISTTGARMDILQTTQRAVLEWNTFNIGRDAHVHFEQPAGGAVLNRVLDTNASQIFGRLTSTAQVFLVNAQGTYFAPGAQVDVGSLVASTLGIANSDFMAGRLDFQGNSSGAIINAGNITAARGGTIAMIAAKIINDGSLTAEGGNVLLGAGSKVTLDMGGPVKLQIENDRLETLIQNGGAIRADGGTIWLTSQAAATLTTSVINNTGLVEANTLATGEKGEIILFAHDGDLNVGGTIRAPQGFVETSGKHFSMAPGTKLEAGDWLIDPVNVTVDATLATAIENALKGGSDVTITTSGGNTPDTSAGESGTDGNITVDAAIAWGQADGTQGADNTLTLSAHNNIAINENITHTHNTTTPAGGLIFKYGQGSAEGGESTYTVAAGKTVTSRSIQWKKGSDANSTRYAVVDGNYFLGNKYIELGLCGGSAAAVANCTAGGSKSGKFGTSNKPSLFFGRAAGSGIGMTGDADGFGAGTDLRIDYFLPGTPAEQFTVGYTGGTDAVNFATAANSGTYEFLSLGADNKITMKYSAVMDSKLKVEQEISLKPDDKFFNNKVTLTNVGAGALDAVRFVRSFDPDNTVDKGGGYSNIQKIDQTLAAGDAANVVSATSLTGDAYYTAAGNKQAKIIYYSTDAATTVGYGSSFFGGTSISQMVTAAGALSKGSNQTADQGIGIIYTAGTMAAGASKNFSYLTSLDNRDISTILSDLNTAAGATPRTTTTTDNTPKDTAIKTAQTLVVEPVTNIKTVSGTPAPTAPPPTIVISDRGSLPVVDVSGGLAFVPLTLAPPPPATGGSTAAPPAPGSRGTGSGPGADSTSGSTSGRGSSESSATGTASDIPAPEVGGRDPLGFMRVFIVNGGLNLPEVALNTPPSQSGQGTGRGSAPQPQ